MKAFAALALCGLGAIAPEAVLSQQPGAVRESAEVALVEVPVRVLDREGAPVRGLTAANFTVYDDGRPQAIVGFDAIDLAEKVPGGEAGPTSPAARRRFLILFDLSFSQPKAIVAARRAARDFVLSGMGDRDLAAVATYSVEQGVRLLVTFSSDRVQLARAIETLGLRSSPETADPLSFAFDSANLAGMPPLAPGSVRGTGRADVEGLIEGLQAVTIMNKVREDEYARGRVRHLFQAFRDLSTALDTVEGRKDIIYLSEGFHGRYLVGTPGTEEERQFLLHGEVWKVDSDKRFGNTPLRSELNEVGDFFRRSDCVVHAVDIAGIRTDPEAGDEPASVGARESENSLYEIAQVTGGDVLRNANDLGAQLARLVSQTGFVYVLAFRPERGGQAGKYHELKVKVSASGARVLARAGYYERRGFRQLSALERRLLAANVIASEIPFDEIPARVLAVPFASGGGAASVPVLVEIPGAALVADDAGEKLTVEIYTYASDGEDRLTDFFARTISADLTKSRDRIRAGGVRYFGELRLPPGRYRLKTLVRNANTGRMGFGVSAIDVPTFAAGEPYLLPPVFLGDGGDWISVRSAAASAAGAAGGAEAGPYPFAGLAGEGQVPAALGEVAPGGAARVCLIAYHLGAPDARELKLGSQILGGDGRPLDTVQLSVLGAQAPGRRRASASCCSRSPPPPSLSPGLYGLRVFLQASATGPCASPRRPSSSLEPRAASLLAAVLAAGPQAAPAPAAPERAARERAIAGLQARAAQARPGSREAARLASELEKIGAAYLAEGDVGRATELLSEAYALDETERPRARRAHARVRAHGGLRLRALLPRPRGAASWSARRPRSTASWETPTSACIAWTTPWRPGGSSSASAGRIRRAWRGWRGPATSSRCRGASARSR